MANASFDTVHRIDSSETMLTKVSLRGHYSLSATEELMLGIARAVIANPRPSASAPTADRVGSRNWPKFYGVFGRVCELVEISMAAAIWAHTGHFRKFESWLLYNLKMIAKRDSHAGVLSH